MFLLQVMTAECYRLLESIQKLVSRKSLAHVRYLYGALLPASKVQDDSSIPELYYLLREQQEHHDTALSLSVSILQNGGSPDKVRQLEQLAKDRSVATIERALPLLSLRKLLANIASKLEETQCETLVESLAHMKLGEQPVRFASSHNSYFESLLAVFVRMEQQQLLVSGDHRLLFVRELLENIGRKDVISKYLDSYNPKQPFRLAVVETEGRFVYYI